MNNFISCSRILTVIDQISIDKSTMESETLTKRKSSGESNHNAKHEEGEEEEIGLKAKMTLMNGVTVIVGKTYEYMI